MWESLWHHWGKQLLLPWSSLPVEMNGELIILPHWQGQVLPSLVSQWNHQRCSSLLGNNNKGPWLWFSGTFPLWRSQWKPKIKTKLLKFYQIMIMINIPSYFPTDKRFRLLPHYWSCYCLSSRGKFSWQGWFELFTVLSSQMFQ